MNDVQRTGKTQPPPFFILQRYTFNMRYQKEEETLSAFVEEFCHKNPIPVGQSVSKCYRCGELHQPKVCRSKAKGNFGSTTRHQSRSSSIKLCTYTGELLGAIEVQVDYQGKMVHAWIVKGKNGDLTHLVQNMTMLHTQCKTNLEM